MEENIWVLQFLGALAHADGEVDPGEEAVLEENILEMVPDPEQRKEVAARLRVVRDPEELLANPPDPRVTTQSFGFKLLSRCLVMASADGEIKDSEKEFLRRLGRYYRFEADLVDLLVGSRMEQLRQDVTEGT